MRKIREILTPENVFIEYELAGIGSRMIAFTVDTLIQVLAMAIVMVFVVAAGASGYSMNSLSSIIIAIGIILVFIIYFGYFIFFEMIMNGQTPGKKLVKIKVINQNGEPVSFFGSALRNFLRLIDIFLSATVLGTAMVIFTRDYKRVGDFAANTIVVKVKNTGRLMTVNEILGNYSRKNGAEESLNIYPISDYEYSVLKEFMERKLNLGEKRNIFASHLYKYFSQKFRVTNKYSSLYDFFEDILKMNSGV